MKGFQGERIGSTDSVLACVKHLAAYGAPVAGRDYNTVDMSQRELMETYMPPYEAAFRAGARTGMTAQVNVVVSKHEGVVLVPREAVVTTGQNAWIWVISNPATTAPAIDPMPPTITTVNARKMKSRPMVGNTE